MQTCTHAICIFVPYTHMYTYPIPPRVNIADGLFCLWYGQSPYVHYGFLRV